KLAQERPGQTLQATALVHEAYLRLVGDVGPAWNSRGHFFAAAAEAMRRILIEQARSKATQKRGGQIERLSLNQEVTAPHTEDTDDLLALNEALDRLSQVDNLAAQLVKLRYFAGLTVEQAADVLAMSPRSAYYAWNYARSWLRRAIRGE